MDDIVITCSDQDSHFQTKDLRKLKYFLGIEIAQSNSGTGMLDCKHVDIPIDPNVKFVPRQGEPL